MKHNQVERSDANLSLDNVVLIASALRVQPRPQRYLKYRWPLKLTKGAKVPPGFSALLFQQHDFETVYCSLA